MKIFVFTYDRFDSITTSQMLEDEGIEHTVLCHTLEQHDAFIAAGRVKPNRLVVTNQPRGLAYNRNVALDLMDTGEWAVFLVDDLKTLTELRNYGTAREKLPITYENQRSYAERFKHPITMGQFIERAAQTAQHCDAVGARLGGFAGIDNPMFRTRHWTYNTLADGRAWVVKKSDLRFDNNVQLIDDLCWTALNIARFGIVAVNQWVLPDCKRYTAGAFGSKEQRMEQKLREASYLVATYPSLVAFAAKAGWPDGSHVVLRRVQPPSRVRTRRA